MREKDSLAMECPANQTPGSALYRPRNPRASPLYQCVRHHQAELASAGGIHRRIEQRVLERFIDCADLHKGFARFHCDQCQKDHLRPYSCKTRYFCPSCHQKRMLAYGDWLEETVLRPVPHRQYVFTLPKCLRPHFHEHLVRYYGWYSNRSRGDREKSEAGCAAGSAKRAPAQRMRGGDQPQTGDELEARSIWARLIRKVYRVDPLICPRCGKRMRLIALIEEPTVIDRILRHLGLWEPLPPMRGPPEAPPDEDDWPPNGQIPITYEPLPDIA